VHVNALAGESQCPRVKAFGDEKIRLLYCNDRMETAQSIRQVKDAGFNAIAKVHWKMWDPDRAKLVAETIALAKAAGLKVFVGAWLPTGISAPAFAEERPFGFHNAAVPAEVRYGLGLAPDIYDETWWREHIIPALMKHVERSREGTVVGNTLDLEIYQDRPVPGIYEDVCFCDRCVRKFCQESGLRFEPVELKGRRQWFADKGVLRQFRGFQRARLAKYVEELRRRTDEINPGFVYVLLPYRTNGSILNVTLAEKLSTDKAPILIATESTYYTPAEATAEQALILTEERIRHIHRYEETRGHRYVLLPGLGIRLNMPQNVARRIAAFGSRERGCWIWGKDCLIKPHYTKTLHAPVDEFWRWFKIGNACLFGQAEPPKEMLPLSIPKYELGPNMLPDPGFETEAVEEKWGAATIGRAGGLLLI